MRINILSATERDLEQGYRFYEVQADGLGTCFLDTRYSAIDSLACRHAPHRAGLP